MPQIILSCPQCRRQLRVTEDLIGRPVRCPACELTFTVPADERSEPLAAVPAGTAETPPESAAEEEAEFAAYEERRLRRRRTGWNEEGDPGRAKALVLPPAVFILVCGALAACINLVIGILWMVNPQALMQTAKNDAFFGQMFQQQQANNPGGQPPVEIMQVVGVVLETGSFVVSLVVVVSAIQMMRGRMFGLAVTGAILAMVNFNHCCCLLGLPAGIWGMIMLLRPEARSYFNR